MEHITADSFESKVLKSDKPVVIDFYADWCGPCKRLAPIFEELEGEMDGVSFVKVDVEDQTALAMQFGVQSIPTIMVFKGGEPVERVAGLMPKDALKQMLAQHA